MPYVFPYEDLFVYITAALIVGLLFFRVRIARRQKAQRDSGPKSQENYNHKLNNQKESPLH